MKKIFLVGAVLALVAALFPGAAAAKAPWPYNIYNVQTGKCIDLPWFGPGVPDGPVNQYTCNYTTSDNQKWYFEVVGGTGGSLQIRNATDGLCLDLPNYGSVPPGTKVSEYPCGGVNDNQLFRQNQRPMVNGQPAFWLVHDHSGLCLDVDGFGTGGDDARLTLWHCSDTDDHIWQARTIA